MKKLFVLILSAIFLLTNPLPIAQEKIVKEVFISQVTAKELDVKEIKRIKAKSRPEIDVPLTSELQDYIWDVCQEYQVSYELILAVIMIESEFKSDVVSYNNSSLGLMQLNKNTYPILAKELNIKKFNPFNPKHNVKAGVYYLSQIRDCWRNKGVGDEEVFSIMLMTYHYGDRGMKKYIKKYGMGCTYVDKIMEQKMLYEGG